MASLNERRSTPPAGLTSEFASSMGQLYNATIGIRVVGIVLTTVFIAIRIITRRDMGQFKAEDYFIVLAYVLNLSKSVLFIAWAPQAASLDTTASQAIVIAQESYALELFYILVLFFAKSAMLLQLRRTFAPLKSGAVYIAYCLLFWLNVGFTIVSVAGMIAQCVPLQKMWDPTITGGYCVNRGAAIIVSAIFNAGTDVVIFLLPLWSIWHLKKTIHYRMSVGIVFATAFFAIVASVGRTIETVGLSSEADETNHFAQVGLWSAAETVLLIICPCFLFMPRFMMIVRRQPRPVIEEQNPPIKLHRRRRWFGRRRSTSSHGW